MKKQVIEASAYPWSNNRLLLGADLLRALSTTLPNIYNVCTGFITNVQFFITTVFIRSVSFIIKGIIIWISRVLITWKPIRLDFISS